MLTTYHLPVPLSWNLGTLNFWNPLCHSKPPWATPGPPGPLQACYGNALPLLLQNFKNIANFILRDDIHRHDRGLRLSFRAGCHTVCGAYKYICYDTSKCWTALRTHFLYRISAKWNNKWGKSSHTSIYVAMWSMAFTVPNLLNSQAFKGITYKWRSKTNVTEISPGV